MGMEHITRQSENPQNKFEHIVSLGETPLHKRESHEKNNVATETFQFFQDFLRAQGCTEYTNVSEAYAKLPNEKIIARREDPRRIFDLYTKPTGYEIAFTGDRYANSVSWNPHTDGGKNLHNAFMEGFTNLNGVVAVVGFAPDANGDLLLMPDSIQNFHGLDRSGVRSYQGAITQSQVHFVTLRIPAHLLPESELTDDEIGRLDEYLDAVHSNDGKVQPVMIFRTFLPPERDK
jgi:hypothetical protein